MKYADLKRREVLIAGVALAALAGLVWFTPAANALADSLGIARSYEVSCTTGATRLRPASGLSGFAAFKVWNNSTTAVYIGGSDVDTSTKGYPICTTSSCDGASIPVDAKPDVFFCRVAVGSVTVKVLAGGK